MDHNAKALKGINEIVDEYLKIASDDVVTTVELNKLTKDIREEHFTYEDTKNLIGALFTKTGETFKEEADKKKIQCLKKVVSHIVESFFDAKGGVSDALFFPGEESERGLVKYLNTAKSTLEICVFTISNDKLAKAVEGLHNRGVKVRLITDDECANNKGSDIYDLADKGIPVRTDGNMAHMHNKYAIIDNKVLITGSFNWTWQAVKQNQENLIIVEKEDLVRKYKESFEKLWTQFAKNTV
jgi:phosphatidylserine/phosphatidylglycerophosphate/cardiolipin synthase-like enzyme